MSQLNDLVLRIEAEFGLARAQSSRLALIYLQSAYEEGWAVGEGDIRRIIRERIKDARLDPRRIAHVSRYSFRAIKDLDDFTRERIRGVLMKATADATLTTADVVAHLEATLYGVIASQRIPVIGRTEVNRVGNTAKLDRYRANGLRYKQALTARDSRVRTFSTSPADHTAIDGQVQRINRPFRVPRVGGSNPHGDLHPPFDPNCRCTVLPVPEGAFAFNRAAWHDEWIAGLRGYEEAFTRDLNRKWRDAADRANVHILNAARRVADLA